MLCGLHILAHIHHKVGCSARRVFGHFSLGDGCDMGIVERHPLVLGKIALIDKVVAVCGFSAVHAHAGESVRKVRLFRP